MQAGGDEPELDAAPDQDHSLPSPGGVDQRLLTLGVKPVLVPDLPLIVQGLPAIPDLVDGEVSGEHNAVRLFGRERTIEATRRYLPIGNHLIGAAEAVFDR